MKASYFDHLRYVSCSSVFVPTRTRMINECHEFPPAVVVVVVVVVIVVLQRRYFIRRIESFGRLVRVYFLSNWGSTESMYRPASHKIVHSCAHDFPASKCSTIWYGALVFLCNVHFVLLYLWPLLQLAAKDETLRTRLKHEQEKLVTTLKDVKETKKSHERVSGEYSYTLSRSIAATKLRGGIFIFLSFERYRY